MSKILLFNKPFQVLTQFTSHDEKSTLADYINRPNFYAAGRLDYDSEGLLILTDDGNVQHQLSNPKFKMEKTYWAQVEGEVDDAAIEALQSGVELKDGMTKPAKARKMDSPSLWDRVPPIRERQTIPTSWIELKITEGKNRQVRRMTAAVGFPTLRLVRYAIGNWSLEGLSPGELREDEIHLSPAPASTKRTSPAHRRGNSHKNRSPQRKR